MSTFEAVWEKYDANGDGFLDKTEAEKLIREYYAQQEGQETTQEAVDSLFNYLDGLDGQKDGKIEKDRLRSAFTMLFKNWKL